MAEDRFHGTSQTGRIGRTPARLTVGLVLVLALGLVVGGVVGLPGYRAAGQVQPTSTPIRLTQVTPVAQRTPTPRPEPTVTSEVIVIVVEDDADETGQLPAQVDLTFAADDWEGGYYRGDGEWYGRAWTSIYGAQSRYPGGTLRFELETAPETDLVLTVEGLDDELAGQNPIALEVNGERVYEGESPFESWDANVSNQGADAEWTAVEITLPAELFTTGENTITLLNLSQSGNFNAPPYVLVSEATLASTG
jgi:hypothetical protein